MKWTIRIMITAGVSALVAVTLSLFPGMDKGAAPDVSQIWRKKQTAQLTDRNMVDLLVQMPLQLRIRKVELNHSIVSIDLSLPRNAEREAVYRDLYTIAQTITGRTTNVNQLLVRVMDYSGGSTSAAAQLVLAMEADREHGSGLTGSPRQLSAAELEQQLQSRFHITYTTGWQQRYPL